MNIKEVPNVDEVRKTQGETKQSSEMGEFLREMEKSPQREVQNSESERKPQQVSTKVSDSKVIRDQPEETIPVPINDVNWDAKERPSQIDVRSMQKDFGELEHFTHYFKDNPAAQTVEDMPDRKGTYSWEWSKTMVINQEGNFEVKYLKSDRKHDSIHTVKPDYDIKNTGLVKPEKEKSLEDYKDKVKWGTYGIGEGETYIGSIHTHPDERPFSPADIRAGIKNESKIYMVQSGDKIYAFSPTDQTGPYIERMHKESEQMREEIKSKWDRYSNEYLRYDRGHVTLDKERAAILSANKRIMKDYNIDFYEGNVKDGILKKVE
jgi:hypothetical protein